MKKRKNKSPSSLSVRQLGRQRGRQLPWLLWLPGVVALLLRRLSTVLQRPIGGLCDLGVRVPGLVPLLLWHHLGVGGGRVDLVVPIPVGIAAGVHRLHRGLLDQGLYGGRTGLVRGLGLARGLGLVRGLWLVRGLAQHGSGGGFPLAERQAQEQADAAEHDYDKAADNAASWHRRST